MLLLLSPMAVGAWSRRPNTYAAPWSVLIFLVLGSRMSAKGAPTTAVSPLTAADTPNRLDKHVCRALGLVDVGRGDGSLKCPDDHCGAADRVASHRHGDAEVVIRHPVGGGQPGALGQYPGPTAPRLDKHICLAF